MPEQDEWTPLERQVVAELSRQPMDRSSECLEPEQMLDLIETPEGRPIDPRRMAHLATCPSCRHAYFEMQQTWRDTADLRHANRASVTTSAVVPSARQIPPSPALSSPGGKSFTPTRFLRSLLAPA